MSIAKQKAELKKMMKVRKQANCGEDKVEAWDYADFLRQGDAEFFALAANQFAKIAEQYIEALEVIETNRLAQAYIIRDLESLKYSGLFAPGVYDVVQTCIRKLLHQQNATFGYLTKVSKETAK